ncbi:MAG: hypothetical protein EP330_28120 [Deltaproteobacteria bacterium]|nr:MAG: hypothetical protein EP330_28120 [Deltaproteobacteria bacterium]
MRTLGIVLLSSLFVACNGEETTDDNNTDSGDTTVECADGVCVLSGTITEDLTLTADNAWLLRGGVFIGDDENETVLTIEPGTTVYGESSTDGMLVVRRHSKLMAEGTATAPIVFTSSKAEGSRARGDWGGLILNGNAPINACVEDTDGCQAYGEGGTGWYGGDDANDSSGVLKYVRVEFAGTLVSPDNELNGIAFQGVGAGTEVDYVQVHMNADDGIEFFGGTAQVKHVLITGVGDDSMDWTDGWTGKAQFVVLQQYDDSSDNGIEADNNGDNNDATPRSMPTISNVTIIGSPNSAASDSGMLLREGTAAHLSNILVTGMNDSCLDVDHTATFEQISGGALTIENTLLDCVTTFVMDDESTADPTALDTWFAGQTGNVVGAADLEDPFNLAAPNFAPKSTSAALGAGATPSDAFFDSVDFIGAVGADDWTTGWTTAAAN